MKAPAAIMFTHFNENLTACLEVFLDGTDGAHVPGKKTPDIGVKNIASIKALTEDHNTSYPFPYVHARFNFRTAPEVLDDEYGRVCDL
jgi:glutamine synthetase type III